MQLLTLSKAKVWLYIQRIDCGCTENKQNEIFALSSFGTVMLQHLVLHLFSFCASLAGCGGTATNISFFLVCLYIFTSQDLETTRGSKEQHIIIKVTVVQQ